jgi:hypothetical protein
MGSNQYDSPPDDGAEDTNDEQHLLEKQDDEQTEDLATRPETFVRPNARLNRCLLITIVILGAMCLILTAALYNAVRIDQGQGLLLTPVPPSKSAFRSEHSNHVAYLLCSAEGVGDFQTR